MKLFFQITNIIDENESFNWSLLQKKQINYLSIKKQLNGIQVKNLSKDFIDNCMNITFNYNDIKLTLSKISKNLVIILDILKVIVDYSIKKNMKDSLLQTNINVCYFIRKFLVLLFINF